jgi:tetratricopeptide (TPR) repeat protein
LLALAGRDCRKAIGIREAISVEGRALNASELADLAEALRQQGRRDEARNVVARCLERDPRHPRALLLLSRLQYQEGRLLEALQSLRALESVLGRSESLSAIANGLERLRQVRNAPTHGVFATETMADVLVEQGYLLEAVGIYRQLCETRGGDSNLREKIFRLRERLRQEGSRDAGQEKVAEQLAALERWSERQKREE